LKGRDVAHPLEASFEMICRTIILEVGLVRPTDLWCNVIDFEIRGWQEITLAFGGPISARPKSEMRITPSDPLNQLFAAMN
jgi:hypothetical protein